MRRHKYLDSPPKTFICDLCSETINFKLDDYRNHLTTIHDKLILSERKSKILTFINILKENGIGLVRNQEKLDFIKSNIKDALKNLDFERKEEILEKITEYSEKKLLFKYLNENLKWEIQKILAASEISLSTNFRSKIKFRINKKNNNKTIYKGYTKIIYTPMGNKK